MLLLGCKPPGRYTEQHDILFTIAQDFASTEQDARAFWLEASKIHIDAWKEVTMVDGYRISILPKDSPLGPNQNLKLFFINLGGYKENEFDEFHYKVIIVAESIAEAISKAKETTFCLHHPGVSKISLPHVDDKYGIDVDDYYQVSDILPQYLKEDYRIEITNILFDAKHMVKEDEIHLGYQKYEKIK